MISSRLRTQPQLYSDQAIAPLGSAKYPYLPPIGGMSREREYMSNIVAQSTYLKQSAYRISIRRLKDKQTSLSNYWTLGGDRVSTLPYSIDSLSIGYNEDGGASSSLNIIQDNFNYNLIDDKDPENAQPDGGFLSAGGVIGIYDNVYSRYLFIGTIVEQPIVSISFRIVYQIKLTAVQEQLKQFSDYAQRESYPVRISEVSNELNLILRNTNNLLKSIQGIIFISGDDSNSLADGSLLTTPAHLRPVSVSGASPINVYRAVNELAPFLQNVNVGGVRVPSYGIVSGVYTPLGLVINLTRMQPKDNVLVFPAVPNANRPDVSFPVRSFNNRTFEYFDSDGDLVEEFFYDCEDVNTTVNYKLNYNTIINQVLFTNSSDNTQINSSNAFTGVDSAQIYKLINESINKYGRRFKQYQLPPTLDDDTNTIRIENSVAKMDGTLYFSDPQVLGNTGSVAQALLFSNIGGLKVGDIIAPAGFVSPNSIGKSGYSTISDIVDVTVGTDSKKVVILDNASMWEYNYESAVTPTPIVKDISSIVITNDSPYKFINTISTTVFSL